MHCHVLALCACTVTSIMEVYSEWVKGIQDSRKRACNHSGISRKVLTGEEAGLREGLDLIKFSTKKSHSTLDVD